MAEYNCELPGARTPFTGGQSFRGQLDLTYAVKSWIFPSLHTIWSCVQLFDFRTNDLDARVEALEREVAVLKEALQATQRAGESRPPAYSA